VARLDRVTRTIFEREWEWHNEILIGSLYRFARIVIKGRTMESMVSVLCGM
jgi:hypothetical protein